LKQVEKLLIAQEVLNDLIRTEIGRRSGSFDSESGKRAIEARWQKHRERKAAEGGE
jgi:hypothetical protein